MKIPEKVKDIFMGELFHQFATVSAEGVPNIFNIGAKYLFDDETIIVVDNYMKKTLSNILENSNVSILIRRERESYQIKGKCSYKQKGKVYEEAKKWIKAIAEKYPAKGVLIIKVEDIYNAASGSNAGEKILS